MAGPSNQTKTYNSTRGLFSKNDACSLNSAKVANKNQALESANDNANATCNGEMGIVGVALIKIKENKTAVEYLPSSN